MPYNRRLNGIYCHIKQRCNNKNDTAYMYYGGKGVNICEEWNSSYKLFKKWAIENGYEDELTIDRIDSNGNYEPNNCRWITRAENTKRAHYGRVMNDKTKNALLKSRIGVSHTNEARKKISKSVSKINNKTREEIRLKIDSGISRKIIKDMYNTSYATISRIANNVNIL